MRPLTLHPELRGLFAALLAVALAQSLMVVIPAWAVQHLFDRFSGHSSSASLPTGSLIIVFVATALTAFLLEVGKRRLASEIGLRHAANLRNALFRRIVQDPSLKAQKTDKGTLLLPFIGDLTASRRWFGEGLARGSAALVLIPVLLTLIATRSGELALALAIALLLSLLCSLALSRPLDRAVREVRRHRGGLTAFITGRLDAAATIKASGRTRRELRKVESRTAKLSAAERRRAWVVGLMRGLTLLTNSILVLVTLLVGSRIIAAGGATPGAVVAILSLVGLLAGGMTDLARAFELWHPAKVAEDRLNKILRAKPRRRIPPMGLAEQQPTGPHDLTISRLSLANGLRSISAQASAGERVLIDGSPGEGKSALLAAIAQLIEPSSGAIHFGSVELGSIGEAARRALIGFASKDSAILPGSLAMNIAYRGTITKEDVVAPLASQCGLEPLITRLPGRLKGRLTPETPLSDAERHGIFLARALFEEPPLLLLDSIDAPLAASTLAWLTGRLHDYPGVVLFIAAREEFRAIASRRWLLEGGRLHEVAIGTGIPAPGSDATVLPFERNIS
ncbi:MAG TPA: ABC transporter ATP-binding protein [Xanthobacteraceae bacterium]|nr:ABC transporter ATP-binding protein [Xanthobacteraceae bacterium]